MVETQRLLALRTRIAAGVPLIGDGRALLLIQKNANEWGSVGATTRVVRSNFKKSVRRV